MNKVENAISVCENHLMLTNAFGTEIEAFLTRYLIIYTSSYFEETLEEAFINRAMRTGDVFVIEYFKSEIPQKMKSVGITKLSNFVRKFGTDFVERFSNEIIGNLAIEVTSYGNIIRNRHMVAHETQGESQMTFNELVNAYKDSIKIINKMLDILND